MLKRSNTRINQLNKLKIGNSNNTHIQDCIDLDNYTGKSCFIIGGGPSLTDFDFSLLKDKITIGINRSFEFIDTTFLYINDKQYYNNIIDYKFSRDTYLKFKSFPGHIVMPTPWDGNRLMYNVKIIKRSLSSVVHTDINDGIFNGSNSGFGSIMFAIALGIKTIYLLGFDMSRNKNKTHYHSGYYDNYEHYDEKLNIYKKMFILFHKEIEINGVQVYNLNRDSNLKCFKFKEIGDIIE